MKKYIYKCSNCGHEFVHNNPQDCPSCHSEEFKIIGTPPPPPWKILLIASSLISIAGLGFYFLGLDINNIKNMFNENKISYTIENNHIKFKGDIDDARVKLKNNLTGKDIYQEGNKFYPCNENVNEIIISYDSQNYKLDGNSRFNFTTIGLPHVNACKAKLEIIQVSTLDSKCNYKISVNNEYKTNKDVEISIDGINYKNQKFIWNQNEIGSQIKILCPTKE